MRFLQLLTMNLTAIVFVILSSSLTFLPSAQRSQRRHRSTPAPSESSHSGVQNDYAERAIIGRVNSSGHAAINPRARDIINNQNGRERKDSLGGFADLAMFDEGLIPTVNCSASCTPREALKRIRVETIKLDILKKLRISTMPNMTNQRLPDIAWVRQMVDSSSLQNDSPFPEVVRRNHDSDDLFAFDSEHSTTLRTIIFPNTGTPRSSYNFSEQAGALHLALEWRFRNLELMVYAVAKASCRPNRNCNRGL